MGAVTNTDAGTLADFEELLPDSRVEKIWERLRREFPRLPEDVQLATYIQPSRLVPSQLDRSRLVMKPERAVFLIVSPNPHHRHKGEMLKTVMSCSLADWRDEEKEAGHYVGKGDPAMRFFRAGAREHLQARKNWTELI